MQTNVARSLGYAAEKSAPQSATCHKCGSTLYFDSNAIGQTIERCPRGCYARNISAGRADPVQAEELAKQLEENRRLELMRVKSKDDRNRERFGEKVCELDGCDEVFVPKAANQRFCSQPCATIWTGTNRIGKHQKNRTLGAATDVGRKGRRDL